MATIKISELRLEDRMRLSAELHRLEGDDQQIALSRSDGGPYEKRQWTIAELRESIAQSAKMRSDLLHWTILDLLRKKKEEVTKIGHPAAVNKGKLIDEIIADIEKLNPGQDPHLPPLSL